MAAFDFEGLEVLEAGASRGPHAAGAGGAARVWAASDLHVDYSANLESLRQLPPRPHDVLLVAGDVAHRPALLRESLGLLRSKFAEVFFCPGNHDLWLATGDGCKDSVEKLLMVERVCEELGVRTKPAFVNGVVIVPLLSWYETGFDREPDIIDDSVLPVEKGIMDMMCCKWPSGLSHADGSLARFFDERNSETLPEEAYQGAPVISFSHFLPRPELLPEKRVLYYPSLPKAVGSRPLAARVEKLQPRVHVFGHTHCGWAGRVDGIFYFQAAVAYPREWKTRGFTVGIRSSDSEADAVGQPLVNGEFLQPPLPIFDPAAPEEVPAYNAFWTKYYEKHTRQPNNLRWIYRDKRSETAVDAVLRPLVEAGDVVDDDVITKGLKDAAPAEEPQRRPVAARPTLRKQRTPGAAPPVAAQGG